MSKTYRCFYCGTAIMEKFACEVDGNMCHEQCVRCSECHCLLDKKCFYRNGSIFCISDFCRLFGSKCHRCGEPLLPNDFVHKVKCNGQLLKFHTRCFVCSVCGSALPTGSKFLYSDDLRLLCFNRCLEISTMQDCDHSPKESEPVSSDATTDHADETDVGVDKVKDSCAKLSLRKGDVKRELAKIDCTDESLSGAESTTPVALPQTKRRGPRTTIKPDQLEKLNASFAVSQKPSRQTREDLSSQTGLDMRVIQVWFQNRRSKMRRMNQQISADIGRTDCFLSRHNHQRNLELTGPRYPQRMQDTNFNCSTDACSRSSSLDFEMMSAHFTQRYLHQFEPLQQEVLQEPNWSASCISTIPASVSLESAAPSAFSSEFATQKAFHDLMSLPPPVSDFCSLGNLQTTEFHGPSFKRTIHHLK